MFPKAIRLRTLIIMSSLDWFEPGGRENFARITRSVRTARLNVYSAYPLTTVLPIRRFFDDSPNRFKMNYLSRFTRIETSSADFASIFKAPSVIAFRMSSLKYFAYTSLHLHASRGRLLLCETNLEEQRTQCRLEEVSKYLPLILAAQPTFGIRSILIIRPLSVSLFTRIIYGMNSSPDLTSAIALF